eukprot:TRINITY_DN19980_c0_g1_i1.p1 TRINITY_DN19980_c0_g1~~TRINITY_DN19980_c0_g1_i1.p1  ORF type:complete len:175 (-),score=27.02 TRINITY_DN19980_c0_g1_i1:807-1331(-)
MAAAVGLQTPGSLSLSYPARQSLPLAKLRQHHVKNFGGNRRVCRSLEISCSKAEGPRRPASAPPLRPPPPAESAAPTGASAVTAVPAAPKKPVVTVEYQREMAKKMTAYFEDKKFENQIQGGRIFGFTRKNEIGNGRWTMFGIAVGLLTEYATGVDFIGQIKQIVTYLGIADIE